MSTAMGVGMAANIIGGEMQGWASILDRNAMGKTFANQMAQQQGYRDQGAGIIDPAIQQAGSRQAQADIDAGAGSRRNLYSQLDAVPSGFTQPDMQSSSSARDEEWASMRGAARAQLGAYNDWSLNQTLRNITTQENLRQLSSFAGGQAGVYPYQMYQAQHSNDDLAMIGAAIASIGGGAANYAQYASAPQPRPTAQQPSNFYNPYNNDPSSQDYWSWNSYMAPQAQQPDVNYP